MAAEHWVGHRRQVTLPGDPRNKPQVCERVSGQKQSVHGPRAYVQSHRPLPAALWKGPPCHEAADIVLCEAPQTSLISRNVLRALTALPGTEPTSAYLVQLLPASANCPETDRKVLKLMGTSALLLLLLAAAALPLPPASAAQVRCQALADV